MKSVMKLFLLSIFLNLNIALSNETDPNPIDQEKFKAIATKIFKAQQLAPEKFDYSSNLSLGLYFIRYLGELGKFKLRQRDINQLVVAIESLYGEPLNSTLKHILSKIRVVRFSQGKKSYRIFIRTINSEKIRVPIDVKREGPISSINDFYIEDKATIDLWDIISSRQKKKYFNIISKKHQLFTLPKILLVSKEYKEGLKKYLDSEVEVTPVVGKVKGMGFNVSLKHWIIGSKRNMNVNSNIPHMIF